jgi:hypothetical protein
MKIKATLGLVFLMLFGACSSEGIDRNRNTTGTGLLLDDEPQPPTLGSPINSPGPSRYVQLEKLNFAAELPAIISILFRATDQYDNALPGLQTNDFLVTEDDLAVSSTETSLSIVPHNELPFSLRTVIMIDISSSILPSDLLKITDAVRALLIDETGRSTLIPQQEIALYTFDDTITQINGFSSNAQSLVASLDAIQPAIAITPTDLYGAVIEGTAQWEDSFDLTQVMQGSLIVVTDGSDTAGKHTFADAQAATVGKSVYTLGVGDDVSPAVLQTLGRSGSFTLRNFDQLRDAFQTIGAQVVDTANSFYYLHYASPKRRAEGDVANSDHELELSVVDNANSTPTATIADTFNSAEFTNVSAQVVVSGPSRLETLQSGTYRARTRWGPTPDAVYRWEITSDNGACAMSVLSDTTVTITGVAPGNCTISATDPGAGNARTWFSVQISAI